MQLTIELDPSDPHYTKWRSLLGHTAYAIGAVSYSQAVRAIGDEHGFIVRIRHKNGYPTTVTLDFEQDRMYTMFLLKCL